MMKVANKKVTRRIGFESMKAARWKNLVAILAIALTTVLFTALFTILLSVRDGYEAHNFRRVGSCSHGGFKYLTEEQVQELSGDEDIKEYGLRRIVGMAKEAPFHKNQVEISYCDENMARWMFMEPEEGKLPREGTNEAATDTAILSLLGVEPVIGTEFTMTFDVDGTEATETFVLSGYWEYDPVITANHVLIPLSRAEEIFEKYAISFQDGMTGTWNMDVMLNNSFRIIEKLLAILERHGYQEENRYEENYIPTGVNWGYISSEVFRNMDITFILAVAAMLALIIFTGYLIIYNVFRISVANDIRFYGILKTVGATGRQLKCMIRQQAFCLSVPGILTGLLLGWAIGGGLVGIVINEMSEVRKQVSADIWIFTGAALFSLFTVFMSCRRPGKLAASVSPVEAVRYTESNTFTKKERSGSARKGASLPRMAWANLGRSRSKTAVTVVSLSLSLVILNITVTLSNGFDMNKYLRDIKADFLVADASYFRFRWDCDRGISEDLIAELEAQGGIAEGGRTYGNRSGEIIGEEGRCYQYVTEEVYRNKRSYWEEENLQYWVETENREQGLIQDEVQLYGMEPFILDQIEVVEGDFSRLYGEGNYIAAVRNHGSELFGNWAEPGDKVLIRYVDELEYFNPSTGEVYPDYDAIRDGEPYRTRPRGGRLVEYEVAAVVEIPTEFSYRYWFTTEFVLNADTYKEHSGTDSIVYYAFNMEEAGKDAFAEGQGSQGRYEELHADESGESHESGKDPGSSGSSDKGSADSVDYESNMERFLADYTENADTQCSYESKATFVASFDSLRKMYIILGCVLSFIVGMVGTLNFVNVIVTGVLSRKRELAILQSVGMTEKQLKSMLILEGLYYELGSVAAALILTLVSVPVTSHVMNGMLWFFSYHFTVMPVIAVMPVFALLGVLIPWAACRSLSKRSVVERLREAE